MTDIALELQSKEIEVQKCKNCKYGEIYKDFSDANRKFHITADAAQYFDLLLRKRGIYLDNAGHIKLIFNMLALGCKECRCSQGIDVI